MAIIGVPNKGSNKSIPQFRDKVDIGDKQVEYFDRRGYFVGSMRDDLKYFLAY